VPGLLVLMAGGWLLWSHAHRVKVKQSTPSFAGVFHPGSTAPQLFHPRGATTVSANARSGAAAAKSNPFAYRLSNTGKTIGELVNDRRAILLENALIDTGAKLDFSIPKNLQAQGDPGAYIVQADGPISPAFRAMLAAAGAQVVSYIPNDAYLVRISSGGANMLAANPLTQSVLPYEPYYKVQSPLLAFDQKPLPPDAVLNLGLFADNSAATIQQIEKLGATIVSEDSSPFGPIVRVQPPENWTALAQLPGVQVVEPSHTRIIANDLSRVTTGVATNTLTGTNYLGLTGKNVVVEVNDTGIDATHPDFSLIGNPQSPGTVPPSRVFGAAGNLVDTAGHGTHVAGIIAGNGSMSITPFNVGAAAQGSVSNADFRGKAPLATLFAMDLNDSDQTLQEAAALTNALISNNSWGYGGDTFYDLAAASYDAAVRDALSETTGSQPVLFVFAAGNDGHIGRNGANGDDSGGEGTPDTISSPGTAKDVITVGALQQLRNITNLVTPLDSTNPVAVWQAGTSSSTAVADYSSRGNVGIGTEGTYGRFKPDVVAPGSFVISTRSAQWDERAYYNPTNYYDDYFADQLVDTNAPTYYNFPRVVQNNTAYVSIQVFANALSPNPFPTNMPIYVSLNNYPAPPDTTTYDFEDPSPVMIPPDGVPDGQTYLQSIIANYGGFNFAVADPTNSPIHYDLQTEMATTNDLGNYFTILSNLNNSISGDPDSTVKPHYYRYESGTSMAAAEVSGILALMQDFFTNTLQTTPSPALLKAMLINGARPTGFYKLQVDNNINIEGWGLVNLPNSIPSTLTNSAASTNSSFFFVDQSTTNALATGDSRTYNISLSPAATAQPLRLTLAWTDPPGNPVAAIKLVNNLDLIVTNTETTNVYFGNDIGTNKVFNTPENPTNPVPNVDAINNVENVFLPASSGTNFTVVVRGTDVNVNAVTSQSNNIVQDFALVISSGNGTTTNGFSITAGPALSNPTGDQRVTIVTGTNGAPLMNQIVGASSPLLGTNTVGFTTNSVYDAGAMVTVGQTNQWHFYVVTNYGSAGFIYAAFVTFLPETLSIPREGVFAGSDANSTRPQADIDLYVASGPNAYLLTNLDLNVIANCITNPQVGASAGGVFNGASLSPNGSELVVDTNSTPGQVYYVGVKCEDQTAAEYAFLSKFSNKPFSTTDSAGNVYATFDPVNIPDGDATHPGYTDTVAIAYSTVPVQVQRVVVTNILTQQNAGDLVISLNGSGSGGAVSPDVLLNHDSPNSPGVYTYVYDDSGQNDITNSRPSDGPGSLQSYVGQNSSYFIFTLHVADNAPAFIGTNQGSLMIQPHQPLQNGVVVSNLPPGQWFYDYVAVPPGATNLTITLTNLTIPLSSQQPLQLYIKFGSQPTTNNYDKMITINSGTPSWNGSLTISLTDVPPLQPGTYYVGVLNPATNTLPQTFFLIATILPVNPFGTPVDFGASGPVPLLDDAVTISSNSSIAINTNLPIVSVNVGIRVDHPRISDLVFHLISPDGTRVLLMENRGGDTTNGAGATIVVTNIFSGTATGGPAAQTNFYNLGETAGTVPITYDMFTIPDQMTVYYSTNATPANLITNFFTSYNGTINISFPPTGVPATSTYLTVVMNETNHPASTAWTYTIGGVQTNYLYLMFTDDTNLTTTPIKYAVPPFVPNTAFSNAWSDSFETYPTGIYSPTKPFGGWTVRTNQVAIVTNPPAYTGTNSLSLMDGAVSYTLPTVAGQKYTLQYAQGRLPFTGLIVANAKQAEPVDIGQVSKFDLNGNGSIYNNTLIFPYSVAFDNNGNLYVADDSDNTIYKFTPPGANGVVFATAASGLYQPQGLACDSSGNLYVANEGNGTIYKFTPGGVGTFFANAGSGNISSPDALAFDGSGNLYVANYDDDSVNDGSGYGTIEEFKNANPNSAFYFATFTNGLENPVGLTFDNTGTNLYVANDNAFGIVGNTILEFSPPSTNVTVIATLNQPTALAFDNNGNLYVTDIGTQAIYKIANGAPVAGTPPIFAANDANNYLNSPEGLAFYTSNSEETNSANWQPPGLSTFTASQPNMPLVLDASGGGFVANSDSVVTNVFSDITLFDEFSLTAVPTDLYYQPEQSLSALAGTSPEGNWQLEIQDDRTGATNNTALVSWELQFILDNTNALPGTLFGGAGQTNFIGAGGIAWYQVTVPAVANYATNRLKFSSAPVNVWFDTNSPPTTNILFLPDITYPSGTNGSVLLSTAGASPLEPSPNIVPDETYYLGVQNTNSFTINYAVEVDFDAGNVKTPDHLMFTSAVRKASGIGLQWTAALGAQVEVQWSDALTSPMQWNTITNPAATTSNGVSTFTDNGSQSAPLGAHRFYRLVQLPPAPHQLHR
jgi:subtilisin-like proprotein convertase family protein/sugar lactone lactonase YvrE